jgi:hypothetical protein
MFTTKHHDGKDPDAGQWALTRQQEFSVFNIADVYDLLDEAGNLYGILPSLDGGLHYLGTDGQQVAMFRCVRDGEPWHGFPLWPLGEQGKGGPLARRLKAVFRKMEEVGLIGPTTRRRLQAAKHVTTGRLA